MSRLILNGEMCTIGDMQPGEEVALVGTPRLEVRLEDGRVILLSGLTRDECRVLAPLFMDRVALVFEGEQAPADTQTADLFAGQEGGAS